MKKRRLLALAGIFAGNILFAEYVGFSGFNGQGSVGSLAEAANWPNATLPSGSLTGVVSQAVNIWTGNVWQDLAVRQTGGTVRAPAGFAMRGGPKGSGVATVYEIDDPRNDYTEFVSLDVHGGFVMWSQFGEPIVFNLLSGHVETEELSLNAPDKATVNFRNGILHAGTMKSGKARINMLSGGSGEIIVDVLDANLNKGLYLNFESDSCGRVIFGAKGGGLSAGGIWAWLIKNEQVLIDGAPATDSSRFIVTVNGTESSIRLAE